MPTGERLNPTLVALLTAAAIIVVVAGLRAAQSLLVPLMISAFLAIICTPLVSLLTTRRVPLTLAVLIVVILVMVILFSLGAVIGGSISELTVELPKYQLRWDQMTGTFNAWVEELAASRGLDINSLELAQSIDSGSLLRTFIRGLTSIAAIASSSLLVFFTLIFMLFEASQMPLKLQALMKRSGPQISSYSQVSRQIQRYLALKTLISFFTGVLVTIWLTILGVDFALVWGLLAFLLNFIPNIGSIIAAIPAVLLSVVQLGIGPAVFVIIGYFVVNVLMGNVIEPRLMGQTLGLSTLVVFLSLIFWGWVWGTAGMLLSIPLTMVVKIMLESNPQTRDLAILLSDEKSVRTALILQEEERSRVSQNRGEGSLPSA